MGTVEWEVSDGVATLVLNRPEKLNCLNWESLYALERSLLEIGGDQTVRVLVLRGAGDRAFSTGGDLKEFRALDAEGAERWIRLGNSVFDRLESFLLPTLAVIDGYAYGGGLELALCCDLRVATPESRFASPELRHGWIPGWGGLTRIRRVLGESKAREMIYLGDPLDAQESLRFGLLNWVVARNELPVRLAGLVEQLKTLDRSSFACAKAALNDPVRAMARSAQTFDVLATLAAKRPRPE